jgi:hypothetical protein
MRQTEESKQFFFKKKNQKTFVYKALALPRRVGLMDKSFCFFFQKEVLSSCRCVSLKAAWYNRLAPHGGTLRAIKPFNPQQKCAARPFNWTRSQDDTPACIERFRTTNQPPPLEWAPPQFSAHLGQAGP